MSQWWTYRLSDFLLFSPRTYFRLFELYNEWLWPAQPVVFALWAVLLAGAWRAAAWAPRALFAALALAWAWVAWAFHWQHLATINWAANGFALAFALQAVLLLAVAVTGARAAPSPSVFGPGLLVAAWLGMPWRGLLSGRPGSAAESFGLTPDATTLGTFGVLLMFAPAYRRLSMLLWLVPLLLALVTGATLWAMEVRWAALLPVAGTMAIAGAWRHRSNVRKCHL